MCIAADARPEMRPVISRPFLRAMRLPAGKRLRVCPRTRIRITIYFQIFNIPLLHFR